MKQNGGKTLWNRLIGRGGWRNLSIILFAAVLLELVSALQYYYAHDLLEEEMEDHVLTVLNYKAYSLRQALNSSEQTLREHLWDVRRNLHQPDSLYGVLARAVQANDKVVGGFLCFMPDYFPEKGRLFEPYVYEVDSVVRMEQIGDKDGHDYTMHPAFKRMLETPEAFWSDPYEYQGPDGVQSLTTYSYPLLDQEGNLIAIYGIDMSLEWLGNTLNAHRYNPSSFGLFLTQHGQLAGGPSEEVVSAARRNQIIALINDSTVRRSTTADERVSVIDFYDEHLKDVGYIYTRRMQQSPYWIFTLVCYDKEVYGQLDKLRLYISLLMLVGFLLIGFIVHRTFNNMVRLHRADMKQERLGSELRIASNIQQSMLPKVFPPFPERNDIDIYGMLLPAREVGGDLFDFFIRDEKLFFCIGDVTGKGVPSAMIMAQVHSLFRIATTKDNNPGRLMQALNGVLCQNNESNMFITFFLGVLNLPTGRLRYCNAGHDCPIVVGAGPLEVDPHLPLGVFEDVKYDTQELQLEPGTTLFLYTDGLTEAKNERHEQFRLQRVEAALTEKDSCQTLIEHMRETVGTFVNGAEQSDDLTMLAIRYQRPENDYILDETIVLKNDVAQTPALNEFVKQVCARLSLDDGLTRHIRLAVEEAVVNVMEYAYPDGQEGDVTVTAQANATRLKVTISDEGRHFDPTQKELADVTLSAEERSIGGLGLLLVRELMDSINYEREGKRNVLTLRKNYR
jgi:sigma-B regulation protein RsbU (phosphoserine phosphatase)